MKRKITEDKYRRRLEADHERLQRMRRRWPKIAEAADHPLTAAMAARSGFAWEWLARSAALLIVIALFVVFSGGLNLFTPICIIVVVTPFKRRRFGFRMRETFAAKRSEYLVDLWLTPLSYRQLAGVEAGRAYLRLRWQSRFIAATLCLILSAAAVWISELVRFAPRWSLDNLAFTGGFIALAFSFISLSDDLTIQSASVGLYRHLRVIHHRKQSVVKFTSQMIAVVLLVFFMARYVFSFSFRSIYEVADFLYNLHLPFTYRHYGALFFVLALGIVWLSRSALPRWTERLFEKQAAKGETWYKELAQMSAEDV